MKLLEVKGGALVHLDADTWEWAKDFKWFLRAGYAARYVRSTWHGAKDRREEYLHRAIMGHPVGLDVHHVDEDPLNCLRENLRVLTRAEHRKLHRLRVGPANLQS